MQGRNTAAWSKSTASTDDAAEIVKALHAARERMLALVAPFSDEQLETTYNKIMSPLVWDLGHIAAYEELWLVHRYGGQPLSHPELSAVYDAFETPRAVRGSVELLKADEARQYLADVRARTLEVLDDRGPGDGYLFEMVTRHELQHTETMLQAIEMAHLPRAPMFDRRPVNGHQIPVGSNQRVHVPGGSCQVGSSGPNFCYDNEFPEHRVQLASFDISRFPVSKSCDPRSSYK